MSETCGPYVRLWGIQAEQLPPVGSPNDDIKPLLTSILSEALAFIDSLPPPATTNPASSPWHSIDIKTFPSSVSPVHLYRRSVPAADLQAVARKHHPSGIDPAHVSGETWALRRSVHEDRAEKGTATWDEFVKCFKDEHAESEKEFTPTVLETQLKQSWNCEGIEIEHDGTTWTDWTLKQESSLHKLPSPLSNRRFPVVQATASAKGRRDFLVVQIAARESSGAADSVAGVVRAAYTSIERVRETGTSQLEWVMGTTSDAKGVVPAWMQKYAVPGQIAKDVGFFLDWIAQRREAKEADQAGSGEAKAS